MGSILQTVSKKFDSFGLYLHPSNHTINLHHSTINTKFLLYFRILSLTYLTLLYLWGITTTTSALNNIIYLTMQGYFLSWLYFLLIVQDYMMNGVEKWALSSNLKYYIEIIYEIAFAVELPITIIFWGFLFRILINMEATTQIIILNANLHAGPFILLCIDTVYNTFSFPRRHFIVIFIFSVLYMIINMVYTLKAHIIYGPIPWTTVLSYVLMAGSILMTYLMHWIGGIIYKKFKKQLVESQMIQSLLSEEEIKNPILQKANFKANKDVSDVFKETEQNSLTFNRNYPNLPDYKQQF